MSDTKITRREVVVGAGLALAAGSIALTVPTTAFADQGNMEAALRQLQSALDSLHRATPNKGGRTRPAGTSRGASWYRLCCRARRRLIS